MSQKEPKMQNFIIRDLQGRIQEQADHQESQMEEMIALDSKICLSNKNSLKTPHKEPSVQKRSIFDDDSNQLENLVNSDLNRQQFIQKYQKSSKIPIKYRCQQAEIIDLDTDQLDGKAMLISERTLLDTRNKYKNLDLCVQSVSPGLCSGALVGLARKELKEQQMHKQESKRTKSDMKKLPNSQPKKQIQSNSDQRVISKKTLEFLAKKFQELNTQQNNYRFRGGNKITLRSIGDSIGIGVNMTHKLYSDWQDDPTFYDRLSRYDPNKKVPERTLTFERLQHVGRLLKLNPFMTQCEISVELNKIQDLKSIVNGKRQEMNKQTVSRLLKIGKFRKKKVRNVPREKNTSLSLEKRYQFCIKYKELLDKQARVYFLDESGFNLYMIRQKAWSRPNQQITVNCPISKGKRFSLIAIIGQDGLAHYRIIQGTYRMNQYLDFIKEMFEKVKEQQDLQDQRENWLIMDNCSIHQKQATIKMGKQWQMNILYLPSYSPQLNPIQMWFHEVKTKIRKINYTGERQLLEIMHRILNGYEEKDFSNYYHGTLKFVEKGLRKQKF